MAIPNEKLQQLLQEIEQKSAFAQQQLGIVKSQIASKNRASRMLQLSSNELDTLPKDTPVYDGVGKMWDISSALPEASANYGYRFVLTSTEDVKARQAREATDVKNEISNLEKKLHYLEMTYKNSQQHMEQLFKRGG
ncbi:related to prefoldin subunit 1 [Lecanosticta acicola]|uniref:Related to prefoldin subunit 1 n=1 Tax=Lecanosticta acicola TaxID=111012 RepID=A0AAI9E9T4_9PEZI|nr:related to prefoldin subunit 1 [Lecanosticta acicola]